MTSSAHSAARASLPRRVFRDPTAVGSVVVLAVVVLASSLASVLTSYDPTWPSLSDALAPPGGDHPLGADGVGRDVFARLLYGGRTSLVGALIAVTVAVVIGVPSGLLAGYYRGRFDAITAWLADLVMAVPAIILLLVVLAVVGQNTYLAMIVFGVLMAPGVFRLIRASVTSVREELYVDAARVSGLGDGRIMRRHILPVVIAPTIIQAAQMFGVAILIQSGLEFLGLGSASEPSWGSMLNDAFANIYTEPMLLLWPGVAMALTVAAFVLLGNSVRDALEGTSSPRRSRRRRRGQDARTSTPVPGPGSSSAPASGDDDVATNGDELLIVRGLRVSYPGDDRITTVVDGVGLTVRRQEVLGLVGESGSGKTQTAFAILGLLPPQAMVSAASLRFDGNDIELGGRDVMRNYRGSRIAYVPQEPMSNLDPSFRIGSQLTEPMRRHLGLSRSEARRKALELLQRVDIADPERVYHSYPHQISGGMAQRVLIAGAVSCDPDLLIADEPTTALDVTVQAEVLDLMRSLQAERHMGLILVTHNFGVVADLCDRVAVMRSGRIVESGPCQRLFASPQHPYTQMLLASTLEGSAPRAPRREETFR